MYIIISNSTYNFNTILGELDGRKNTERFLEEPIPKLLFTICSQTIMSVMLASLYSLVDTFFVARGVGAYAAGAVSVSAPVLQIIGAFASTVGAGGASIISRALGEKNKDKAAVTAANTFILFWSAALIFSAAGLIFLEPLLRLLAADAVLMPYAKSYTRIILIGAVTATGFSSLMRAEGNIRFSIYQWIIPTLVNLVLDPLFIFIFRMGVNGAVLATVIAQVVSTGLSLYYFFLSKWHAYPIGLRHFKVKWKVMAEIMIIGSPTLLSQLCSSGYLIAVNNRLGYLGGPDAISAFGIISRIKSFLFMPISGIVQGLQPVIGFNYSSRRHDRVWEAVRLATGASIVYGFFAMAVCTTFPEQLIRIFISENIIVDISVRALRIIALSFPFMGALTIVSAYFQASGKAFHAFALPIVSVLIISLPVLYLFAALFGLQGVWYSCFASDAAAFSASIIFLLCSIMKSKKDKGDSLL